MNTLKLATAVSLAITASQVMAMNPQPDPQNPNGYIISRIELKNAESAKTNNPMYAIWSKALETRDNTVVEAISPALPVTLIM